MRPLIAAILGLLQGISEFLPISSSGHLVMLQHILQQNLEAALVFDVMLHFATLLAIVLFYRQKIADITVKTLRWQTHTDEFRFAMAIVIGTIPAVAVHFLFGDWLETAFHTPLVVSFAWLVTATLLFVAHFRQKKDMQNPLTLNRAFWIGMAQALALVPGISRSGSTIAMALILGCGVGVATEFSFLLVIPAILGATILQIPDLLGTLVEISWKSYFTGMFVAFLSGLICLRFLLDMVKQRRLYWFAAYCILASLLSFLYLGLH